ncbi:DUF342 domain-containing protein [Paucisalibacillus globulus]|uniref:DUF342 domain-containing protein n=1 Tax=Paucisalibacillus globulus TaxID=351095 RepID=UPI0003FF7667|nr:FapA family protein [Paucisalibacillus globulus]
MANLSHFFKIVTTKDAMIAELHFTDEYLVNRDLTITMDSLQEFLAENNIIFGVIDDHLEKVITGVPIEDFPIIVAKGKEPIPGLNGKITYHINFNPKVNNKDNWNFREVMRIPSVKKDEKLATITLPTEGTSGTNVFGSNLPSKPGLPTSIKAGKNVRFTEGDLSFYSDITGQANVQANCFHVHPVYEVSNTLSMKEGNLNFVGTIVIHGDVPSGYSITAGGDVKIFGMVEAATIVAHGSVYVAEGLAGLQKGSITADENIQIGYVNQGVVRAKKKIYVENSIIHSDCVAGSELICQRGSIIGSHVSANDLILVKHVGNHMNTKTELTLGQNHMELQKVEELQLKKKEIQDTLSKLTIIGEKLSQSPHIHSNPKLISTLQKQRASFNQNKELLNSINDQLDSIRMDSDERYAKLTITGNLYGNTIVTFGKYKRLITESYKQVELELLRNEVYMRAISTTPTEEVIR